MTWENFLAVLVLNSNRYVTTNSSNECNITNLINIRYKLNNIRVLFLVNLYYFMICSAWVPQEEENLLKSGGQSLKEKCTGTLFG